MRIAKGSTFEELSRISAQQSQLMARLQPPAPAVEATPVRKLGVLFVHGIGNQRRGNTLTQFGEPLFQCLDRWLRHHEGGAELRRVTIRDDPTERRGPANAVVRLWCAPREPPSPPRTSTLGFDVPTDWSSLLTWKPPTPGLIGAAALGSSALSAFIGDNPYSVLAAQGSTFGALGAKPAVETPEVVAPEEAEPEGVASEEEDESAEANYPYGPTPGTEPGTSDGPVQTTWVFAESTWADVFEQPSFGAVAFWSIRVVPWLILTQFADQLTYALRHGHFGRALFSFSYMVLTFPLALLIQVLVLLLVPVSLIGPLRPVVAPVQRFISRVIGDAYVLLSSEIQFQSMASKVREDLEWLAERCDVVAVVAHSQGAAVAHEAVRNATIPKLERLITLGSAVSRLKALRYVANKKAHGMMTASSLITIPALVLGGFYAWRVLQADSSFVGILLGLWPLAILLALAAYLMPFTLKGVNKRLHEQQDFALAGDTKWDDYYATADPVPNGRMFDTNVYTDEEREVHNGANIFKDHSTYWQNEDGFCSALLHSLMKLTGGAFDYRAVSKYDVDAAAARRAERTGYRVGARIMALATAFLGVFEHPGLKDGVDVFDALGVVLGWAAMFVNWLVSLAEDALRLLDGTLNLVPGKITLGRLAESIDVLPWPIACGLLALAWYGASAFVMHWWDETDVERHFSSTWSSRQRRPRWVWWSLALLLLAAWIAFFTWWFVLSGVDAWTQIFDRLKPAGDEGSGSAFVYVLIAIAYQVSEAIQRAAASRRTLISKVAQDHRNLLGVSLPDWERSYGESLLEIVSDLVTGIGEFLVRVARGSWHWLISPVPAAYTACLTGVAPAAVALAGVGVSDAWRAAGGLLSLAFGVLAFVDAPGWVTRGVAVIGLLLGALILPVTSAFAAGVGTLPGFGLLTAGAGSAACAIGSAVLLRRGWQAVERDARPPA